MFSLYSFTCKKVGRFKIGTQASLYISHNRATADSSELIELIEKLVDSALVFLEVFCTELLITPWALDLFRIWVLLARPDVFSDSFGQLKESSALVRTGVLSVLTWKTSES